MVSREISKDCLFSVQDRLLWQARGLQCCKECTSIGVSSNWQVSYLASFALLNRCVPFPSDAFVLKVSSKDQRSQSAKFSFQKRPRFAHMKKLFVYVWMCFPWNHQTKCNKLLTFTAQSKSAFCHESSHVFVIALQLLAHLSIESGLSSLIVQSCSWQCVQIDRSIRNVARATCNASTIISSWRSRLHLRWLRKCRARNLRHISDRAHELMAVTPGQHMHLNWWVMCSG